MDGRLATAGAWLERFRLTRPRQLGLAAAILVLAWPIRSDFPRVMTLDISWVLGLQQAAQDGLSFGQGIVFTYGPLGFLGNPTPFVGPTSALAFIATAAIYLALIWLLLQTLLRLLPVWLAALLTLAFARAICYIGPFDAVQILAFGLGVEVLRRDSIARPWLVAVVAGVLASVAILGKVNNGVFVSAMGVLVVLAISRPRLSGLLVLAGTTIVATVGSWLLAGQQLSDLLPYARASAEIISGYSDAMGVTPANVRWIYAAFLVVSAVVVAVAYRTSAGWPRDRRLALAALVILLLFASWKYTFVRNHVAPTFVTLVFATLLLLPTTLRRRSVVSVLLTVSVVSLLIIPPSPAYADVDISPDVVTSSQDFVREARDTFLPWRWNAAADRTRQHLRSAFDVPASIIAQLEGHTVAIDPYAAAIAPAYPAFTWRPVPIFQSYSAYTAALDGQNADMLRSAARPDRILRQFVPRSVRGGRTVPYAMDGRDYWFESPEATVERLCRYQEVAVSGAYQVLAESGRSCGAETPLATVTAARGESVVVPAAPSPDDIVLVRVDGVADGLLARLRAALWRTPAWSVLIDGVGYRLVPGTAADGLVLAVPAIAQGSAPFAFGAPTRSIAIRGPRLGGSDQLRYEFFTRRLQGF